MKSVSWSLFPLVPSLWVLVKHTSSYSRAKLTACPYFKLDMKSCINQNLNFFSKWPRKIHPNHTHHPFYFPKCPKPSNFMHNFVLVHLEKRRNVQVCKLVDPALPHVPAFSWFLHIILAVPKCTKNAIKIAQNATYHLILILYINFQSCPLTDFQPWQHCIPFLTPYIRPSWPDFTYTRHWRETNHICTFEARKHFSPLEVLLSSFLLLHSSNLKTTNHCWWGF